MLDMSDLWSPEDWIDLPDDDEEAFARLVQIARVKHRDKLEQFEDDQQRIEISHAYMTILMGVAKARKIQPFLSQDVPYLKSYSEDTGRNFESDLMMFQAQTQAKLAKKNAAAMVNLKSKDAAIILMRVHGLRQKIGEMPMEAWRKRRLMAKLSEFEAELKKGRVDLGKVAMLAATLITIPGGVAGTAQIFGIDVYKDLVAPIIEARADAEEDEWVRKLAIEAQPRLLPSPSIARIARTAPKLPSPRR